MSPYGQELILDMHKCGNVSMDVNLQTFCEELAQLIDMQVEDFHIWASEPKDEKNPKLFGQSAIQFILTSNITIHTLPLFRGGSVYINLFSCKPFDVSIAKRFCETWFEAKEIRSQEVQRI